MVCGLADSFIQLLHHVYYIICEKNLFMSSNVRKAGREKGVLTGGVI